MSRKPVPHFSISRPILTGVFFFFILPAFSQTGISNTGSKLAVNDAGYILQQHNAARAEVGVPPLHWNQQLAAYAQDWATYLAEQNNGNIKHRQYAGDGEHHYGENIFWGSSADMFSAKDATLAWYDEKEKYTYAKLTNDNWVVTGHYTQMIWKNTTDVGVGVAIAPNGAIIVVANYFPAGNVMSNYPY